MPSVRRNQPFSAGTLPPLPQPPTPLHEFSVCGTASIGRACMIHGRSLDFGRIYFEIPPTPKSAKIHVWPAHASVAACDPHVAPWGSSVCRPVHGHGRSCSSRPLDRSASMDSAGFRRGNARHFGHTSRLDQPRAAPQHAARLALTCLPTPCAPDRPSDDRPFLAPRDIAVSVAPPSRPRFATCPASCRSCERSCAGCFTLHVRRCTRTSGPMGRRGHSESFRGVHGRPIRPPGSDPFSPKCSPGSPAGPVFCLAGCVQHVDVPTDALTGPSTRI
jgi:hypothetical protein